MSKNKNKKVTKTNIGIIIITVGVICVFLGIILFGLDSFKTKKSSTIKESDTEEEATTVPSYNTKEEVLEAINSINQGEDITVTFDHETDGCWFFTSNESNTYEYCTKDNEIKIYATESSTTTE